MIVLNPGKRSRFHSRSKRRGHRRHSLLGAMRVHSLNPGTFAIGARSHSLLGAATTGARVKTWTHVLPVAAGAFINQHLTALAAQQLGGDWSGTGWKNNILGVITAAPTLLVPRYGAGFFGGGIARTMAVALARIAGKAFTVNV